MEIICCKCRNFDTEICENCSIYLNEEVWCSCHINPPCFYCENLKYEDYY